ncbi:uncharacterized protein YALI1_A02022g [Yarrowia lipolytica]|uniref:Uncharacterized protein n=1 Tax=Yarrowia lipolytica TaxID=4952 RepID=A0A1D8N3D3_YARLL|nr:hypothetical protein YALI1_A02022g [Yarrowia lipolytica]
MLYIFMASLYTHTTQKHPTLFGKKRSRTLQVAAMRLRGTRSYCRLQKKNQACEVVGSDMMNDSTVCTVPDGSTSDLSII